MNDKNLTVTFTVDQTPEEVFNAIQNVRGWWSEGLEGASAELGDEFSYRHRDLHYSKQKLTEVVPAKKMVWLVVDANLSFTKDTAEWKGTRPTFEISRKGNQTEVRFTHVGLTPEVECFDACTKGWTFFVGDSLRSLITTGKGKPDRKEVARRASATA